MRTEMMESVRPVPRNTRATTEVDGLVGLRVKLRRVELGVSQEKLAGQLGITAQQLQKYERGTNRVGASRLFQIAKVLDVPVQYFFQDIVLADAEAEDEVGTTVQSDLLVALEDTSTVRLLRLFADVRDPALKSRVVSLVEAVVRG